MSRKSRDTLLKERLEQVSKCSYDLFNEIEPSDEIFEKIKLADQGDISAIRELCTLTYSTYKNDFSLNQAMLYYAKLGMAQGDLDCALVMLKCIEGFNEKYELLDSVLDTLDGKLEDEAVEDIIARARVKKILAAASPEADYSELTDRLSVMYNEYSAYARLYLASRMLSDTGSYDKARIDALAAALDVPSIVTLPVFIGEYTAADKALPCDVKKECDAIRFALTLINMDLWQDFWIRVAYEYSKIYLDSDLSVFAEDITRALKLRCEYPKRKLHILAVKKYMLDLGLIQKDEFDLLDKECRFNGLSYDISDDTSRDEMIKEAVYTDSAEQRKILKESLMLGTQICHTKNRYLLMATLTNHMKRGSRHLWDITLSIKTSLDDPPAFAVCRISDRMNEVTRYGIKLDKEKKLSQISCMGEIHFGEKIHPLEYDLILDISYVSSTKCEYCEIKIKDHHRVGDHIVMDTVLSIY